MELEERLASRRFFCFFTYCLLIFCKYSSILFAFENFRLVLRRRDTPSVSRHV
jgi:hypothetical protein